MRCGAMGEHGHNQGEGRVVVRATPARGSPGEKSPTREMVQLKTAVGTALAYAGNLPG